MGVEAKLEWAAAWVAAWAELPAVEKTRRTNAGAYTYTYADLSDVLATVRPVLARHGFAVSQSAVTATGGVGVETRITHKAGHTESYGPTVVPFNGDARAAGGAITYARRYALSAALGIATEDDTDARPDPRPVTAPEPPEPPDSPLHTEAWGEAKALYGDQARDRFITALRDAGIPEGHRIETSAHLADVLALLHA